MRLRRRGAAALAIAVGLLAPGVASAKSVTKTEGDLTAVLTWQQEGDALEATDPRLDVTKAGVPVFGTRLADVCKGCYLIEDDPDHPEYGSVLGIRDLDGDGTPEVTVDTYSGGAHCCTTMRVYGPVGGAWKRQTSQYFGNTSYEWADVDEDGRPEILTRDDSFSYAFASYAGSAYPPLVLRPTREGGKLVFNDVTRSYPALARTDAAEELKRIRRVKSPKSIAGLDIGGPLAAYAADQALLGKPATGLRELNRAVSKKLIKASVKKEIVAFLKRTGYLR